MEYLLIEERINYYEYDCLVNEKIIEFLYTSLGLIGFRINNQIYVYSFTLNGEIDYIYSYSNSALTKVSEYKYDAFGNITIINYNNSNIGNVNPIRYKGYYYDDETQLFYCNSRYYSPELCRWISPDSIEYLDPSSINGLNLYSYCNNNPVMYSDPSFGGGMV